MVGCMWGNIIGNSWIWQAAGMDFRMCSVRRGPLILIYASLVIRLLLFLIQKKLPFLYICTVEDFDI